MVGFARENVLTSFGDVQPVFDEPLTFGVFRIRCPKIRTPPVQHVLVECSVVRDVIEFVRRALEGQPEQRMVPFSPYQLNKHLQKRLKLYNLDFEWVPAGYTADARSLGRRLTPASLRPGMATADYLRTPSTSRTQWRHRWSDPKV